MAGEIQEAIGLDFQADSVHLGSVSFGRFKSEPLCWERRSIFSHNRYLEEVKQYSKPGLVTEKKAYFEAHFRKKGIRGLSAPESQNETTYQTSDNDCSEKMAHDEDINCMNVRSCSSRSDESQDGSLDKRRQDLMEYGGEVSGTPVSETHIELSCDNNDRADCILEHGKVDEEHHIVGGLLSTNSGSGIEMKHIIDCDATVSLDHVPNVSVLITDSHPTEEHIDEGPKYQRGEFPPEVEHMKPILVHVPRLSVAHSRRHISSKAPGDLDKKSNKTLKNVLMGSRAGKNTLEAAVHGKFPMSRTQKYEPGSGAGVLGIKRGEKESRDGRFMGPQSSTLRKVSGRVHQSASRVKQDGCETKHCSKPDSCMITFKRDERADRKKGFDMKFEDKKNAKKSDMRQAQVKNQEKTEAEIKKLRKNLNFKATPLPSFYTGALRKSDRSKATARNGEQQHLQTKSSSSVCGVSVRSPLSPDVGKGQPIFTNAPVKKNDPAPASGATSCHSTLTSDSSPSSPDAKNRNRHNAKSATNSQVSEKKEKDNDKLMSLHKHRGPEGNKIYKAKAIDSKQKKNTEMNTYSTFNRSSRTGRIAVGLGS